MRTIEIFDTTLRDGEQSPGAAMAPRARLRIARMLAQAQIDTIEAGFPAASPLIAQSVAQIAKHVRAPRIAALARCVKRDIDAAAAALQHAARPRIHVFVATSEIHLRHKLRISAERAIEMVRESVAYARRLCDDVEFSAEDATRSDHAYLAQIFTEAIAAGARTLNVPDTVGYATPDDMRELITFLREHCIGIEDAAISVHTHDDLGMATANALAAIQAGASQVECTINGIGERAGNASMEEIVMAMRVRRDVFACDTNVDTSTIQQLSKAVAQATRMPVQKNKAIVGANAFAHESGIHQDGVLKERTTYEIIDASIVGNSTTIHLGRNSGMHAVMARAQSLGIGIRPQDRSRFYDAFIRVAQRKRLVDDADLHEVAEALS